MVVSQDHRSSVERQRGFGHVPQIDARLGDASEEHLAALDDPVLRIEEDNREDSRSKEPMGSDR
jgi:hypothetical protein